MKNRSAEIELMLRIGRDILKDADRNGLEREIVRGKLEAIRVHNTTLRTEIALDRVRSMRRAGGDK